MNILGFFQRLCRALQLPIAVLPVAGNANKVIIF